MITGLVYAIVTTDDVPRARQFFTEKLGLSTEADMGDAFSQFTTREGTMWAVMSRPATPPVWNVRMVSCVPGSPIDCAAMMPTASPMPTSCPVARLRP